MALDETSPDHGPIQPEQDAFMNALAGSLDELLNPPALPGLGAAPRTWGFFLAVFPFDSPDQTRPGKRFNYISNADRLDVRATLADLLARLEGRKMPGGRA